MGAFRNGEVHDRHQSDASTRPPRFKEQIQSWLKECGVLPSPCFHSSNVFVSFCSNGNNLDKLPKARSCKSVWGSVVFDVLGPAMGLEFHLLTFDFMFWLYFCEGVVDY